MAAKAVAHDRARDNGPSELLGNINDISDSLYDSIRFADGILLALTGLQAVSGGRSAEGICHLADTHVNDLECLKEMIDNLTAALLSGAISSAIP
jgi:hypothetical protein